ncbi:MAG: hypothetical protein A3H98_11440 [Bacteroidetes bacterium RIFCSPLOWO2_02_FULL_36_8]|nr:MAG: hypothetical protein A3H98_11440 [Bacteroidetes bacterium RIFCSPLOWO2_02_FULL_36_8]OFY69089.1 MAG: hypothetical protein A3G23_05935 [Bacteroidetes bacterium RIFCSPLOWO2_12_FULL_37_12]
MKKLYILLTIYFTLTAFAKAQKYDFSAGVRFGQTDGITVKKMMKRYHAIEGILHTKYEWQGALVTVLKELHKTAFRLDNLYWFYGLGGHVGVFHGNAESWRNKVKTEGFFLNLGVDAILGLEWDIEEIPFTLGVDIKPTFDLLNSREFYWDGSLSARYLF